jgi:hypothetical protein
MAQVIPIRIAEQPAFFNNLATVATTYATTLNLTTTELTNLSNAVTAFQTAYEEAVAAKDSYRSAIQQREKQFETIANLVRAYNREWQNTNVSDAIIAELGLPVHDETRSKTTPATPTNLVANAFANGEVKLKWNRNGNISSTQFVIEESTDGIEWSFVRVATSSKVTMKGYTPGTKTYFRVFAQRRGVDSAATPAVVVYSSTEGSADGLKVAA